jgi:hypothetical protein
MHSFSADHYQCPFNPNNRAKILFLFQFVTGVWTLAFHQNIETGFEPLFLGRRACHAEMPLQEKAFCNHTEFI